jgi:hypothetical protein
MRNTSLWSLTVVRRVARTCYLRECLTFMFLGFESLFPQIAVLDQLSIRHGRSHPYDDRHLRHPGAG